MKLRQIVCDRTELFLLKEKKKIKYNEIFEVSEARAKEILNATYHNKAVAEIVKEDDIKKNNKESIKN